MHARYHPSKFTTIGDWYLAIHRAKVPVPTAVPAGIQIVMKELGIGFHEAFDLLTAVRAFVPDRNGMGIDLSAPERAIARYRAAFRTDVRPAIVEA